MSKINELLAKKHKSQERYIYMKEQMNSKLEAKLAIQENKVELQELQKQNERLLEE